MRIARRGDDHKRYFRGLHRSGTIRRRAEPLVRAVDQILQAWLINGGAPHFDRIHEPPAYISSDDLEARAGKDSREGRA